jgi:nitroreductase
LFFSVDEKTPLTEDAAGAYRNALEAVRLAPSAKNRQPWRIVRDLEGRYRLYLKEDKFYNRVLGKIKMQHLDMGIAMAHFELAAREQGIDGRWDPHAAAVHIPGLEHIALWKD